MKGFENCENFITKGAKLTGTRGSEPRIWADFLKSSISYSLYDSSLPFESFRNRAKSLECL